jgi:hypothetical protein
MMKIKAPVECYYEGETGQTTERQSMIFDSSTERQTTIRYVEESGRSIGRIEVDHQKSNQIMAEVANNALIGGY